MTLYRNFYSIDSRNNNNNVISLQSFDFFKNIFLLLFHAWKLSNVGFFILFSTNFIIIIITENSLGWSCLQVQPDIASKTFLVAYSMRPIRWVPHWIDSPFLQLGYVFMLRHQCPGIFPLWIEGKDRVPILLLPKKFSPDLYI